ncbi:ferredoxin [Gordonia crocea]|uniref:Ferredoxin n=1 Tax=Gordonia crocea TaxID=589162 RepID=A0A7I9V1N4_9ACTN|nr:ferredoxin [Gordonia crocea]GED99315.1 cytochrome P450 [Gordonia crocea]GED99324.1 cytochrome P450 [Gordonia crocea]
MRIEVDLDLCQGHGMCEMEAPDVFEAQRDHVLILNPTPDDSERPAIEAAVRYCPTQALRIVED